MRLIDADALLADCQLAQKQADKHGREFANAFYSSSCDISTEWWCVEDMIENAPTIEPERETGKWIYSDDMYETAVCSVCGWDSYEPCDHIRNLFKFCPICGTKMEK